MTFEPDKALDRRRLKRQIKFWRVMAVAALVTLGLALMSERVGGWLPVAGGYVARLDVANLITDDTERDEAIRALADDPMASALIVRIASPGGTVVGGESLYRAIRHVAEKKPVVAVMGELATSAGYMAAIACDRIVAREGTITGSIGVIFQTADVSELLKKIGVATEAIRSGPLKALPSPLEPMRPDVREASQALVQDIFLMFVDMVADRRKLPREAVIQLADGRVFTGRQALANGLIDETGGEEEARQWLAQVRHVDAKLPVRNVSYGESAFWPLPGARAWAGIASLLGEKTLFSERLRLDGLVSVWHPQ